jgi:flagellar basal body P-ring formation protein FlgA
MPKGVFGMTIIRRATALALLLGASPLAAQGFENLDRLEGDLVAQLGAGIGEPGGPAAGIDRRLKLAACPMRPEFDAPHLNAVAIRCPATGWRIRVPLTRGATALADAPAAAPVVMRGDAVSVTAVGRGFTVSQAGVAQENGGPGARIRVKMDPRKPPIYAEVVTQGEVRISGLK